MDDHQTSLWTELQRLCEISEHEKAIKICDDIVKELPGDIDALHIKTTALIHLNRFQDALSIINIISPSHMKHEAFIFEEAYALYRTEKLDDCLKLIHHGLNDKELISDDTKSALQRLYVQVLYRKESYNQCWEICKSIVDEINESNPYYMELTANLAGIEAAAALSEVILHASVMESTEFDSYELAYNLACTKIASYDLHEAQVLLEKARELCRDVLGEDERPEEDIEKELAIIVVQLGYVYQLQGRYAEALDLYQGVIKSKVGDTAVTAIASNNIMALKKDHELFDSAKRYRAAATAGLETKLTKLQKRIIAVNGVVLSMYMNKPSVARDTAKCLLATYPDDEQIYLVLSAIALREKKPSKALEELVERTNTLPKSLALHLALVQLYLSQQNFASAISTMEQYLSQIDKSDRDKPGIVSLMGWLYSQTGNEKGMTLIEEAFSSQKMSNPSISRQLANFKLKSNRPKEAAADFEKLVKADPTDFFSVAGLIMAYSEFNPHLAEKYQSYLPDNVAVEIGEIDAEALETSFNLGRLGNKKAAGTDVSVPVASKEKKKRKRKIRLPKNYDPAVPPDPERWLPKRERSTFQQKKGKKKDLAKGPQGSAQAGGGIGMTGSARISEAPANETLQAQGKSDTLTPTEKKKNKKR